MIAKHHWTKRFFYGNYFYGICAIGLSVECSLQLKLSLNNIFFYLSLFCATVLYYTHAFYIETRQQAQNPNERSIWYRAHQKQITKSQLGLTFLLGLFLLLIFNGLQPLLAKMPAYNWGILFFFGLIGAAYYKSLYPGRGNWGAKKQRFDKAFPDRLGMGGCSFLCPGIFLRSYPSRVHTHCRPDYLVIIP